MAQGFSVAIPMQRDARDGFKMNKSYAQVVTQNLKMLLLTVPGERIMDPHFGVGVRRFLFEQDSPVTYSNRSARIHKQVGKYLSYLELEDVEFFCGTAKLGDGLDCGRASSNDSHDFVR